MKTCERRWLFAMLGFCWLSLGSCETEDCGGGCPGFGGGGGSCAMPYSDPACMAIEQCGQGTSDGRTDPCILALQQVCSTYDPVLATFDECYEDTEACRVPDSGVDGCHVDDARLSCCVADAGTSNCANGIRGQIAIQQARPPGP